MNKKIIVDIVNGIPVYLNECNKEFQRKYTGVKDDNLEGVKNGN